LQILLAGSRCTNILAAVLVVSSVFAALLHMDHVESSFPLVADCVRLLLLIAYGYSQKNPAHRRGPGPAAHDLGHEKKPAKGE
jgi:hypothetical protein